MVPWPTIASPASRTAVWPGDTPANSSPRAISRLACGARFRGPDGGWNGLRSIAQAHRVDARPASMQDGVAEPDRASHQVAARPDRDRVRGRVGGQHVHRLLGAAADAAALADREVVVAAVAPDRPAGAVDQIALALAQAAVAAQEVGLALTGEKAEVLALGLASHGKLMAGGDLAHLGLGQLGEREAHPVEQAGRQRRQHVALVLVLVGGGGEQAGRRHRDDPRVVAGDEVGGADPARQVDHRRDPHLAVAGDAGVGRAAGRVAGDELGDDAAAELFLQVQGQVRDAERVREGARAQHGLGGAAGLGPVGLRVGPELQRHPDHLSAALALEQGGDGAVNAPRHRHQNPLPVRLRKLLRRCCRLRQSPAQCVGGKLRGVPLGRRQPADRSVDLVDADPGDVEHSLPIGHLGHRRRSGPSGPAALCVKSDPRHPSPLDDQRYPCEVPAGSTTSRSREGAVLGGT